MTYHLQFGSLLPYWDVLGVGRGVHGGADPDVDSCRRRGRHRRRLPPAPSARLGSAASVRVYVELIRNTPFIVQLFFIYFGLPALRHAS